MDQLKTVVTSVRLSNDMVRAIDDYRRSQLPILSRSAVIHLAMHHYLDKRSYPAQVRPDD